MAMDFVIRPNLEVMGIQPLRSLAPMFAQTMGFNVNESSTPTLVFTPDGQLLTWLGAGNVPAFGSSSTFTANADAGTSANGPIDAIRIPSYKTRSSSVASVDGDDELYSGNQTLESLYLGKRLSGFVVDGSNGVELKRHKPYTRIFMTTLTLI